MILKKKEISVTPNTKEVVEKKTNDLMIEEVSHRTHMGDSMKGLFYIIKGQYRKGGKSFLNTASGSVSYIGGYDPQDPNTSEWYMVRDYETHNCIACCSNLDRAVENIYIMIKKCKGSARKYFKFVSDTTTDDLYEVRYLGHRPLSHDDRMKKGVGICPRVSPADRCLYDCVYQEYGYYYRDLIEEVEDKAYEELREERPLNKTKKRVGKAGKQLRMKLETSVTPVVEEVFTPKTLKKGLRIKTL